MQQAVQNQLRDFRIKRKVMLRCLPCSLLDGDHNVAQTHCGGNALEIFGFRRKRQHIRYRILTEMLTVKTPYRAVADESNRHGVRPGYSFRTVDFFQRYLPERRPTLRVNSLFALAIDNLDCRACQSSSTQLIALTL